MATDNSSTVRYFGLPTPEEPSRILPVPLSNPTSTSSVESIAQKPLHEQLSVQHHVNEDFTARDSQTPSPIRKRNTRRGHRGKSKEQPSSTNSTYKQILQRHSPAEAQFNPSSPAVQRQIVIFKSLLSPNWETSVYQALSKYCEANVLQHSAENHGMLNDNLYYMHSWDLSGLVGFASDVLSLPEVMSKILRGDDNATSKSATSSAEELQAPPGRQSQNLQNLYTIIPIFDPVSRRLCWWSIALRHCMHIDRGLPVAVAQRAMSVPSGGHGIATDDRRSVVKWYDVSAEDSVLAQARNAAKTRSPGPRSTSRLKPGELQHLLDKRAAPFAQPATSVMPRDDLQAAEAKSPGIFASGSPPPNLNHHQLNLLSSFHEARQPRCPASPSAMSRTDSAMPDMVWEDVKSASDDTQLSGHQAWSRVASEHRIVPHDEKHRRLISWASSIGGGVAL